MGLPTTANYVVVASLMATVLVDVGNASGFIFPLIAVHLFVFYFGLMADVTPPVGLASYAAATCVAFTAQGRLHTLVPRLRRLRCDAGRYGGRGPASRDIVIRWRWREPWRRNLWTRRKHFCF